MTQAYFLIDERVVLRNPFIFQKFGGGTTVSQVVEVSGDAPIWHLDIFDEASGPSANVQRYLTNDIEVAIRSTAIKDVRTQLSLQSRLTDSLTTTYTIGVVSKVTQHQTLQGSFVYFVERVNAERVAIADQRFNENHLMPGKVVYENFSAVETMQDEAIS